MTQIAFIGLGNMGAPMARNLIKAGHSLAAYDLSPKAMQEAATAGARTAPSARARCRMIPTQNKGDNT